MNWFYLFLIILLLSGCSFSSHSNTQTEQLKKNKEKQVQNLKSTYTHPSTSRAQTTENANETKQNPLKAANYAPLPSTLKTFQGDGNEYASFTEKSYSMQGEFLPAIRDNGGTRSLIVYHITKEEIDLVYEQQEFYEETIPNIHTLVFNHSSVVLLKDPIAIGSKQGSFTVNDIIPIIETETGTYKQVIKLESLEQDGSKTYHYWAKGIGIIKMDYVNGDQSNSVSSTLNKIN